MVPDDLGTLAWVGDVALAPDGNRLAFTVTRLSFERDEPITSIWVGGAGGGADVRQFTAGIRRDTSPRWSPDGGRLAFISERPCPDLDGPGADRPQLWVVGADGGEARRLTGVPGGVSQIAWAPDGRRVAFIAKVDRPGTPATPSKPVVTGDRPPSRPFRVIEDLKYRRNGEGFIDVRRHLFAVDADGTGEPRQLTEGDYDHADPAWSPDGREIAFVSARHDSRDRDNGMQVMAVTCGGTRDAIHEQVEPRHISSAGGPAAWPAWSPDGRTITFVGHASPLDSGRHPRVWVAPVSGGGATCVSGSRDRAVAASAGARPTWTADGRSIVFLVEDDGRVPLVRVNLATGGGVSSVGDWSAEVVIGGDRDVSAFSLAPDGGAIAFTWSDATRPGEVSILAGPEDARVESIVTDLNASWRLAVSLAPARRITLTRAGTELTAWVQLPPGVDEARTGSVPVLLNIHGGPHAQYGDRFFDEFAVYAGAGYGVVFTNPRGSTGGTEEFARAVRGDWGGIDAADVLAAYGAALDAFPCLDRSRSGVMGGSYGGYLTSWLVAHGDQFAAACSERALNDFVSFSGTSDIGFWFATSELGTSPFEDPGLASRHSPLTYANAIRTPLLVMHAEQDYRCPIEQAERFYVALARRGHRVRFVRVPDADHELSRTGRPRQRLERFRHILDWFGEFLRPGDSVGPPSG